MFLMFVVVALEKKVKPKFVTKLKNLFLVLFLSFSVISNNNPPSPTTTGKPKFVTKLQPFSDRGEGRGRTRDRGCGRGAAGGRDHGGKAQEAEVFGGSVVSVSGIVRDMTHVASTRHDSCPLTHLICRFRFRYCKRHDSCS